MDLAKEWGSRREWGAGPQDRWGLQLTGHLAKRVMSPGAAVTVTGNCLPQTFGLSVLGPGAQSPMSARLVPTEGLWGTQLRLVSLAVLAIPGLQTRPSLLALPLCQMVPCVCLFSLKGHRTHRRVRPEPV